MKTIVFLGLAALAFATRSIPNPRWIDEIVTERSLAESEFRDGREYRYIYEGQLASGYPGASRQQAATRIQAVVSLVFKSQEEALFKLTHIRMGRLNRDIPNPQELVPFEACEQVAVEEEQRVQLQLPVVFKYNKGLITNIRLDGSEQPWSANTKRGVLNMLQLNLQKHRRTDLSEEARLLNNPAESQQETKAKDFFTTMEETLEGVCETVYTITPSVEMPECTEENREHCERVKVTKSINFDKCQKRPEIKYNHRFQEQCPTCQDSYANDQEFLRSQTVQECYLRGSIEKFVVEKCFVNSQYTFVPANKQNNVIQTTVKQQLELVRSGPVQTQIEMPQSPKEPATGIMYSNEWDELKEQFFMDGEQRFHEQTPFSQITNKVQFTSQTLKALVGQMHGQVSEEAPRQFVRLVKILRMCKSEELQQIHQQIYKQTPQQFTPEEHKKVKDMLVDAIALCGTKDCVEHLVKEIKSREISAAKGAWAIKSLQQARVVSRHMIHQLEKLAEHEVCERHPALKQAALLTTGSLMNALCTDNEDQIAREIPGPEESKKLCPRPLKEQFVQKMVSEFEKAKNTYEKILALKMMKNAAIDLSIFPLEKIAQNKDQSAPHSTIIRLFAIEAMSTLNSEMPKKIQRTLMPIYMNQREKPELRMAAAYSVLATKPEKPVLDQLAQRLARERNQHVASYVYSYLSTIANSTNPCEKQMAADLKLSLHQAQGMRMADTLPLSKHLRYEQYSKEGRMGVQLSATSIKSQRSSLPIITSLNSHVNILGSWHKYLASIQLVQNNADELLWKLIGSQGMFREQSVEQYLRRSPRSTRKQPMEMLNELRTSLNIEGRRYSDSELASPFALLSLKWKNHEFALLPVSMENMPEQILQMISSDYINIREMLSALESGYHFNMHTGVYVSQFSKKIPTSMGLPLRLSVKIPTVIQVHGKVEAKVEGEPMSKGKLMVRLQPSMVSTLVVKMESWSPIVNSGAKLVATAKLHLPVDAEIKVNTEVSPAEIKLIVKPPTEKIELASFHSRPITLTRVWPRQIQNWQEAEEKSIVSEEWNRVNTIDEHYGEHSLGLKFRVQGRIHHTPKLHVSNVPSYLLAGPNTLRLTCEPGVDAPQEVEIKITGKWSEQLKDVVQKSTIGKFYKESAKFFGSEEQYDQWEEPEYELSSERSQKDNSEEQFTKYSSKYETRNPLKSFVKIEISDKRSRKCEIETEVKCGQDKKHCQYKMVVLRSPVPQKESEPWKFTAEAETLYPENIYQLSELSGKKVAAELKAQWGPVGQQNQKLNLKMEGERSQQQERIERQRRYRQMYNDETIRSGHPEEFSPVAQYNEIVRGSRLTQYKIVVDYNIDNVVTKNITNKVWRYLKNKLYSNTEVNQITGRGQENQIKIKITLDPISFKTVNVTAQTPKERVRMQDLPLPVALVPMNMRKQRSFLSQILPTTDRIENVFGDMQKCTVQSRRVQTFDQVVYRVPITTCYSVIAKDCAQTQQPKFAVLLKKISKESELKKIKILIKESEITCEPRESNPSEPKCKVNGQEVELTSEPHQVSSHNHVILREGPYVKIVLPEVGVKVYFDGYTTKVKVSRELERVQCGLCGDYNGEQSEEFRQANNQITEDLEQFHRSYLHQDSECQIDEPLLTDKNQYKYRQMNWEQEFEREFSQEQPRYRQQDREEYEQYDSEERQRYEQDSRKQIRSRREQEPKEQTKVIENGHELCFSKRPVPTCPPHTYATKYTKEQKVAYACLSRSQPEAEIMHRRALRQEILSPEVKDLPASFTETEVVPEMCRRF